MRCRALPAYAIFKGVIRVHSHFRPVGSAALRLVRASCPSATAAQAQQTAPGPGGSGGLRVRAGRGRRHRRAAVREPAEGAAVGRRDRRRRRARLPGRRRRHPAALSGKVPGLYAETTTGRIFPRFYIRGLGNIDFYLGASQPVSIIQDDVVLEHVVLKSNPVFDLQQVEVLRGPQGSLFGRNTTAGIVKFDTDQADPDPPRPRPGLLRQLQHHHLRRRHRRPDRRRQAGLPRLGALPAPRRLRGQHLRRPQRRRHGDAEEERHGRLRRARRAAAAAAHPDRAASRSWSRRHARDYDGTSTLFLRGALTKGSNESNAPRDKVAFDEADEQSAGLRDLWRVGERRLRLRRRHPDLDQRLRDHQRL